VKEFEDTFKPYARIGHVDEESWCDELSRYAFEELPGDVLPERWRWTTDFVDNYGSGVRWAITKSYHALFVNGNYVLRIWHNADTKYAWVDIVGPFVVPADMHMEVLPIPEGSRHKCRPMSARAKVNWFDSMDFLIEMTRSMYGLDG
jgi:hypothetical protein